MPGYDTKSDAHETAPRANGPAPGLDSELKQVMDAAVARVAQIEMTAVVEAREHLIRSEQDARAAFSSTMDRAAELVKKLEALAGSVTEMSSALRDEVNGVTVSLQGMRDGLGEWPEREEELAARAEPEHAQTQPPLPEATEPAAEPDTEASEAEPAEAEPAESEVVEAETSAGGASAGEDDPHIEPSPELAEMFREQITRMRDDGKHRDEAERVLLRFRLGHRFLWMLDDIYSSVPSRDARKPGLMGKLRGRS